MSSLLWMLVVVAAAGAAALSLSLVLLAGDGVLEIPEKP